VKFGHVVFETCQWANKQTDRQTDGQTYNEVHTHADTLIAIVMI